MIIGMGASEFSELSKETREWMQVMLSLREKWGSVLYDDLCAIGLSGMTEALDELETAGMIRSWGGAWVVYIELLWA